MKCDVAIIGAGIGGLAAGARLAMAGYKCMIFEKQDVIGGRYTTGMYRNHTLITAAFYVVHPHGPMMQLLKDVGVESEVEILPSPDPYLKYRLEGVDHPLPKKGGALALLPLLGSGSEIEKVQLAVRKALRWQEPLNSISLRDWLSQYTENKRVHQLFNMMCFGTCGAAAHLSPAGEFFRVVRSYGKFGGNWVLPKGHVKAIVDPLVRLIRSKGSEIQTRTTVKKVAIKDMEVKGLLAESQGKKIEVEAQAVISDCSPHQMIELVGEENLEKGYLEKARSLKAPEGCSIFWECDKPMFDSPSVINFPFYDNPFHNFFAMDLSQTWPDICPKGKYTLWAGFWFPPDYDVRTEIERAIRQCKENFPGLEKHGEILLVQVFRKTWAMTWAINGYDLSQKTPIERLYVVGDGAKPPGFAMAEGVVEGSRLAVEDIKTRIKPEVY